MQLPLFASSNPDGERAHEMRRSGLPRIRYIGSKARVADEIMSVVGSPRFEGQRFVDLFCGGGAISRSAAHYGWTVHANDQLTAASYVTVAQLFSRAQLSFLEIGGYAEAIDHLNSIAPMEGPIYREYAPTGHSQSGHLRKYFTSANAAKIDGIRAEIERLSQRGKIGALEKILLLSDLVSAANTVANIAGTYGCFLSKWNSSALATVQMQPRKIPEWLPDASFSTQDAFELKDTASDILYCDPPYTKRQYAAYYHLIETIVLGDHPKVEGVAGIRAWEHMASPFCYKRRALDAFEKLLASKSSRTVFVSYSSDGHLSLEELALVLARHGSTRVHEIKKIGRYISNEVARQNGRGITEYLIEVQR